MANLTIGSPITTDCTPVAPLLPRNFINSGGVLAESGNDMEISTGKLLLASRASGYSSIYNTNNLSVCNGGFGADNTLLKVSFDQNTTPCVPFTQTKTSSCEGGGDCCANFLDVDPIYHVAVMYWFFPCTDCGGKPFSLSRVSDPPHSGDGVFASGVLNSDGTVPGFAVSTDATVYPFAPVGAVLVPGVVTGFTTDPGCTPGPGVDSISVTYSFACG